MRCAILGSIESGLVITVQVGYFISDPGETHNLVYLAKDGIGEDKVIEVKIQKQAGNWFCDASKH